MQNKNILRGLLALSAVAAMGSAFATQAQTGTGASPSQTGTGSTYPNQAGKTSKDGTMDNSNSMGMENRANQPTRKGMAMGSSAAGQSTGSSPASGMPGMSGMSNMSGKTTRDGTIGNTNSQGTEIRSRGASGTAGTMAASGKLSRGDQAILKDIAMADMAEIECGKMALSKGSSAEVKSYAQQMIDDHTANLNEAKALAEARGVALPAELDARHKAMAAKLEKMRGAAFDKAYMQHAGVQDHKAVHGKLMAAARKARDAELKALVDKTAPVVAQHLKAAQQAAKPATSAGQ